MADFNEMVAYDMRRHITLKQTKKYLPWTSQWKIFKKMNPDATWEYKKTDGLPYAVSPLGLVVETTVTANGETLMMCLTVMDDRFRAMKEDPYTYSTKQGEKQVEAATMKDVTDSIMRCLAKNIAMFGLGLFVYEGEDMPDLKTIDSKQLQTIIGLIKEKNLNLQEVCESWQMPKIADLHEANYENFILWLESN